MDNKSYFTVPEFLRRCLPQEETKSYDKILESLNIKRGDGHDPSDTER